MIKTKRSLGQKLIQNTLLLSIPIFLLAMGLLFVQSRKMIYHEATESAHSALNIALQRVRNYMATVETATNSSVWFAERHFEPDTLLALTNRIVNLNRHVSGCSITAAPGMFPEYGGNFSAYSIQKGDTIITQREGDYDYYSKDWYKLSAKSGKPCWIDPFDDHTEGTLSNPEIIASYSKPIKRDGKIIGVISSDITLKSLSKEVNSIKLPYPSAYFALIGGDGCFYIHPAPPMLFKKTGYSYENSIHEGTRHMMIHGQLSHVAYRPVKGTKWIIALITPDKEMLRSYNQLTYIITVLIIVGLLLILWLCQMAVKKAISPLTPLITTSQKISEGNYELVIPYTDREDAVGILQNSFATMQHSINDHVANIQRTTEETKKSNEELARTMKLAEESLRQKEIFIQNVSHQIRTPLNIIQGFAQVLKETPGLEKSDLAEITSTMKHNALHLNRLVLMLFDCSDSGATVELMSQRNDHVPCNLISSECIGYTKEHFPDKHIQFKTDLPDSFFVRTNHLYLMRTLRELLYNAAKYSDGQHISMHVSLTDRSVLYIVEDKGQGLPEGAEEMVFTPFVKVDDLSEGLGLGLPLAKRHAKSLGGDLTIDTSYHEGCRFILSIPK